MFCANCGNEIKSGDSFCGKCGRSVIVAPAFRSFSYANPPNDYRKTALIVSVSVAAVALSTIFIVFIINLTGNTISGKYGYSPHSDGSYGYVIEFKPNGKCLWSQDGELFSGTYEYAENEYIIQIKGNGLYLSTTFRAKMTDTDTIIITGGIFRNDKFTKIQEELYNEEFY